MPKFEDKFVHFRWSDDLEGKKAFYGDSLDQLEQRFEGGVIRGHLHKSTSKEYPFEVACVGVGNWKFIYYDPNYDNKIAYEQGKQIQCRQPGTSSWADTSGVPMWYDDVEYRIKPDDTYAVVIKEDKLSYVHTKNITCQHVFFRGSQDACHNYIVSHAKFTECMIAYLDNKKLQFRSAIIRDWQDIDNPTWDIIYEYRIKPGLTWTDLKLGDAVRQFNGSITSMITAFDMAEDVNSHVQISGWGWVSDNDLATDWYKL